jgi:hypothetical protein
MDRDTLYSLPDEFIVVGSEQITIGPLHLVRDQDYEINYRFGEIRFAYLLARDVTVSVSYAVFPFRLRSEYFHRKLITEIVRYDSVNKEVAATRVVTGHGAAGSLFESSRITGSGSITRGFTIGSNQDFTLNSGLNIQLSGNVTDDVTLEASLTDENTPIQPEGNTENLQEIDKVFIEVRKADQYVATFGDFGVNLTGTEFGNYSRKLQGVRAAIRKERVTADLALASTKGKYTTQTLVIQEGVQGPYELSGENGERGILIVAGTEKVWLNGILLTRGEDNDYVMDYSAGQLTFTRKRLITSESRVVVDFEYSDDIFRRNSFSAGLTTQWFDRKLTFGGTLVHEADDKNNPINLTLSNALVDSLSRIDDDSLAQRGTVVLVDGATYVGVGNGTYVKKLDAATGDSIYAYVGPDSIGDYRVRFTDVGASIGDYTRGDILGEFVFAGQEGGSFLPLVPLTLPTRTTSGTVFMKAQPASNVEVGGEVALSSFDINAYSPGGRRGNAYLATSNIRRQRLRWAGKNLGEMDLSGRFRHVDSSFRQVDRLNDAEFHRDWNIQTPGGPLAASPFPGENLLDLALNYRPVEKLHLTGFYGTLARGEQFSSRRLGGGVRTEFEDWPAADYRVEAIRSKEGETDADIVRHYLQSTHSWWKTRPGFDLESERIDRRTANDSAFGSSYQLYRPRLDVVGFKMTQFGAMFEARFDRVSNSLVDSLNGTVSLATTQRYYWTVTDWQSLTSTVEFIHREKRFRGDFRNADNLNKLTNLVSSTVDFYPWNRAMSINMNYQISEERIQDRKLIFVRVQPNTGNYTQVAPDSFKQVPQGQGDWIQGSVRSGDFTPIVDLKFGVRVRLDLGRFFPTTIVPDSESRYKAILRTLSAETILRIEENQRKPTLSFYFLDWRTFQDEQQTLRGSVFLRQDVYSVRTDQAASLRLRYELQKNLSGALLDGRERRRRELENVRLRRQMTAAIAWEAEAEYESNRKISTVTVTGLGQNFDLRRFKILPALFARPVRQLEVNARFAGISSRDKVSNVSARQISVQPELVYAFRQKGRASLSTEFTHVRARNVTEALPFELTDGNLEGWNIRWLFNVDYRISNHVNASLNYQGRKEPGQDMIHFGGAEFRAFF